MKMDQIRKKIDYHNNETKFKALTRDKAIEVFKANS